MREYLNPVVKADQCAQYVDDIGIAANNATDLTRNIRAVFKCIRQAGLKLTIEKCHFGVRQVEFLGRTISPEGISPQARKIQNFLGKLRFPKIKKSIRQAGLKLTIEKCHFGVREVEFLGRTISSEGLSPRIYTNSKHFEQIEFPQIKKALQRYLGIVTYYRNYIPRMVEKLNPFYKFLKAEVPINKTSELKETSDSVNNALNDACQLALKQPIPRKQLSHNSRCQFTQKNFWQSTWHFLN